MQQASEQVFNEHLNNLSFRLKFVSAWRAKILALPARQLGS